MPWSTIHGTDTWSAIASIPLGVKDGSAVVDGTLIYLIPGLMFTTQGIVQVYDTVNNTWSQISEPHSVLFPVAGLVDGKLVIAGGSDSTLTQVYDPATGTWSSGPALPTATEFAGRGVISDGQQLFVVGGNNSTGGNIDIVQRLVTDVPMIASATVAITGGTFAGDGDRLVANTTGTSITAVYNATTEALTLIGSDTLADYAQVLDERHVPDQQPQSLDFGFADPTRAVTWTVNDGTTAGFSTTTATSTTIDVATFFNFWAVSAHPGVGLIHRKGGTGGAGERRNGCGSGHPRARQRDGYDRHKRVRGRCPHSQYGGHLDHGELQQRDRDLGAQRHRQGRRLSERDRQRDVQLDQPQPDRLRLGPVTAGDVDPQRGQRAGRCDRQRDDDDQRHGGERPADAHVGRGQRHAGAQADRHGLAAPFGIRSGQA